MKLTALLLFLLFLIPSCTIEKRLHNKGWNVQWRKHHKVKKEQRTISQETDYQEDELEIKPLQVTTLDVEPEKEIRHEIVSIDETLNDDYELLSVNSLIPEDETKNTARTVSPKVNKSISDESKSNTGRLYYSILLIVLGVLAIVVAIGYYASLASSTTLGAAFFTFVFMTGLGILGIILLVVGLVLITKIRARQ